MAIEFRRTPDDISRELTDTAVSFGYTRLDRFIGSFIDVFSDEFREVYNSTYSLDDQTRIDTATGAYLDSWGILSDQPRVSLNQLEDLSFDNVSIETSDGVNVSAYTSGGVPIFIPNGTRILDATGSPIMATIDTVIMDGPRQFIRVIGLNQIGAGVAPGNYRLNGGIQDFVSTRTPGITGSAIIVNTPTLNVVVRRPISGTPSSLGDGDYRFVIFSKARSRNLANQDRVNTQLSNTDIARFVIKEFTSGSSSVSVYIEPRIGILSKPLEQTIKQSLKRILPNGTVIHVSRMVGSRLNAIVSISIRQDALARNREEIKANVSQRFIEVVNGTPSGAQFFVDDLLAQLQSVEGVGDVRINSISINGLSLFTNIYQQRDIEYLFTDELGATIDFI